MNRLQYEKSPYLLQHADNPVDWYPWGEEAFRIAKELDKPIFLSIGYATCHWCHVMEHESFEDPEVARLMNQTFINIKVDREERPDIDELYMTVAQLLTGRGGWPLTIMMGPDQRPFFAATYIPKESRYGRPGMLELIPRVAEVWNTRREEASSSSESILQALQNVSRSHSAGNLLDQSILKRTYEALAEQFDEPNGGFGSSPKFPSPHTFLFLLRYWYRSGEEQALVMVEKTLTAMRRGGIFDHVGYGFHRYSTDARWRVPHFEKMLYDQALLAVAYVETYQATCKDFFADTAREIITYVLRDMSTPEGGFASAEDADSEGEEGRFYTWSYEELSAALKLAELDELEELYDLSPEGNYQEEATGKQTGRNILYMRSDDDPSRRDEQTPLGLSDSIRAKLIRHRQARIRPLKDDKILTSWNGLMIAALARAGGILQESRYIEAAEKAAEFIWKRLRTAGGRLLHRYRGGEAMIPGYATDYAYLIWGMLELYEATFDSTYLRRAAELMELFIEDFWDETGGGGFFLTADEAEKLLIRQRNDTDGALPSAGSVALLDLIRLGRMLQNRDYEDRAAALIRSTSRLVETSPLAFTFLLSAVDFQIGPSFEVVITGDPSAEDTKGLVRSLRGEFVPNKVLLFRPAGEAQPDIAELAPFTRFQVGIDGKATVYVCRDYACELPITTGEEMLRLLQSNRARTLENRN
ncbi:MAG: thioredoxin domain-containing protein [Spirochaetaceae bacterium]|nr:MAG: thioredoxin domain-containing protein [Spirochaetaceae bacterium]